MIMRVIINQTQAIQLLKENADLSNYEVQFDDAPLEALDAILLGKNDISVPEALIYYNDEDIDFSDDPDLMEEDLASGKINWVVQVELLLYDKELV